MHDSHIHLAMEPLVSQIPHIIDNFLEKNGKYILTQGTDILDFETSLEISKQYQGLVQVALGLHPTYAEEFLLKGSSLDKGFEKRGEEVFKKFENIFVENLSSISAIGEVGLDYYQLGFNKSLSEEDRKRIIALEQDFFRRQIQLAKKYNLPLSVHARDVNGEDKCVEDTIRIIAQEGRGSVRGSFHSYTGDKKFISDILDLGFHIGFNGIITYKSGESVREILKDVPPDRILFETDGPFLPPQSVRKNKKIKEKFAQPSDIKEIIEVASEVKRMNPKELEDIADCSYEDVFLKQ